MVSINWIIGPQILTIFFLDFFLVWFFRVWGWFFWNFRDLTLRVPIYASFFFKFQQKTWKLKIKIILKIILFTDNFKWKILTQVFLLKWARNFGILSLDVLRLKKYSQFRRRLTGKHSFWNLGHFLSLSFFFIFYWINYIFFLIFNCQVLRWNL